MAIDIAKLINAELKRREWSAYKLAKEVSNVATMNTVYNMLAGKPVRIDVLARSLDVLDLTITRKAGSK